MHRISLYFLTLPAILLAPALPCAAQDSAPAPSVITVHDTRDPVDKSYRKMIAGMDRFNKEHALAPQGQLRFRLLPRSKSVDMQGLTMKIVGDTFTLPVPLAPDNSFILPRDARALREDAALVANRKTDTLTWRVQVETPGLPPGTRRLGDLRLECLAGMDSGLISNDPALLGWITGLLRDTDRVCGQPDGDYLFFADRPIFGVTLHDGERTLALPVSMLYAGGRLSASNLRYCDCQVLLERSYYVPLWDRRWPDDTLVEFDTMDEAAGEKP
jgi:hypothetical protein